VSRNAAWNGPSFRLRGQPSAGFHPPTPLHTGRKKSFLHHHSLSFATAESFPPGSCCTAARMPRPIEVPSSVMPSLMGPAFWSQFLPPSIFMRSDLPRVAGRLTVGFARLPNDSNGTR